MHPSNDYYGHDMILSWAASVHRPRRTFGYVQHGWKPESGFPASMRLIPFAPLFVWSGANQRATEEQHPRHRVEAIGAPFLYLRELLVPALEREPTKDLLVYPCHQLRTAPTGDDVHAMLIDQVRAMDPTSITVNLHAYEFDDGVTAALYQADLPNASITTNWLRPPWVVSDDPTILVRQILQILDHRRVVSNCLTTALLYAAYLDRDARLLRHPARRRPPTEGRGKGLHEELERATDGEALRAIAGDELGADHLREPDQLRGADGVGLADAHHDGGPRPLDQHRGVGRRGVPVEEGGTAEVMRVLSTWVSRQSKNALEAAAPELAARGIQLRLRHFTIDHGRYRARVPIAIVEYARLLARLVVGPVDVLLVNPADAWLRRPLALQGLLLVARLRRVAVVARWGNDGSIYRNKTSKRLRPRTFRRICDAISAQAVANLVLTTTQGHEVREWVGFAEMDVIGNCKRVPEPWLTAPRTPPAGGLIVNVASVQPRKGADLFVRVAHELVTTSHPDVRFVWVGGTATPAVASLIDELGVAGAVSFRPPMHPPYPVLHQASAMFFPSRAEAFGLAVAEAMACGLPVCCFEGTGAAEVIGECGSAVEMESVSAAAAALREYLDEVDHAATSERSRARYRARFSPAPFAENLARVLVDRAGTTKTPQRPRQLPSR